ncbi:MAG: hypothetical protein R3C70_06855 [Geminicoccaceae bacterium]
MNLFSGTGFCSVLLALSVSTAGEARMLLTDQFYCEGVGEPWQLAIDNRSAVMRHAGDELGQRREEYYEGAHFPVEGESSVGSQWRGTLHENPGHAMVAAIKPAPCEALDTLADSLPDPFSILLSIGGDEPIEGCCIARSLMPMQAERRSIGAGEDGSWPRSAVHGEPVLQHLLVEGGRMDANDPGEDRELELAQPE